MCMSSCVDGNINGVLTTCCQSHANCNSLSIPTEVTNKTTTEAPIFSPVYSTTPIGIKTTEPERNFTSSGILTNTSAFMMTTNISTSPLFITVSNASTDDSTTKTNHTVTSTRISTLIYLTKTMTTATSGKNSAVSSRNHSVKSMFFILYLCLKL
jgi:hypothetical protein